MATPTIQPSNNDCRTIQILEPDSTLLVATASGSIDQALDERGEVTLQIGQSEVSVTFVAEKLSDVYRFEYLYVDAFGVVNPGTINPVVISQTVHGFTVDLAGAPPIDGYILRWRVFVTSDTITPQTVDTPEDIYIRLSMAPLFIVGFTVPRSSTDYGFSELRVENLTDAPAAQTPIAVQVVAKATTWFEIALSPTPPSNNYFLRVRTP